MEKITINNYGGATSQVNIKNRIIVDRESFILETVKGKKVLHIGCCDAPYTRERYNNGSLLFLKIQDASDLQVGMDISTENIEFLESQSEKYIIENINLENKDNEQELVKLLSNYKFDYILMGEVIEHLYNYHNFLLILNNAIKKSGYLETEILITTPNYISLHNIVSALKSREYVHPDHTYWPSIGTMYFTLNKYFIFKDVLFYSSKNGIKNKIYNFIFKFFPLYSEGIILLLKSK